MWDIDNLISIAGYINSIIKLRVYITSYRNFLLYFLILGPVGIEPTLET